MSATTPVPTTTTVAPSVIEEQVPMACWVIITGDPLHKNQKYERIHLSGNVAADVDLGWDSTKPMYFGDGEPHNNLGDSLTFDANHLHEHNGTSYVGIWQLSAMPYTSSWWGNFFRKDLSASPNDENWNPVGVYTGTNPWYEGPPDYTIGPPANAGPTSAEVLHCGDCFDPTGWVIANFCGGDYNDRDGCSIYLPKSYGKYCGGGQLYPREMALRNKEDGEIIRMSYDGGGVYWPPGWDINDLLDEVGCYPVLQGLTKKCPTPHCASWTGYWETTDELGDDQTWLFSMSTEGLGEDSEGDLCNFGGWDFKAEVTDGSSEQEGYATLCCGQNDVGLGPWGNSYLGCCPKDLEINMIYPDIDFVVQFGDGIESMCPDSDNSYSNILGYNVAFNMDGFGVGCDCCRPCRYKRTKDGEIDIKSCLGSLMGVSLVDDPTTTMGPTTTTNEPPTTAAPGTTTTAAPGPTTTTSAPGPTTTTTPDPSRYICVSNGTTWSNGTYEKASNQYNGKDQWSKTDGAETRWVYYHSATYGWSITASNKGNNGFQSADDSGAENPWDVDSSAWTPAVGLNIAIDEC